MGENKIIWSTSAIQDLKDAFDFISINHPRAAHEFLERVPHRIKQLGQFPQLGSVVPDGGFQLIVDNYRIFYDYEINEGKVSILHIKHSRQSIEE